MAQALAIVTSCDGGCGRETRALFPRPRPTTMALAGPSRTEQAESAVVEQLQAEHWLVELDDAGKAWLTLCPACRGIEVREPM